MIFMYKIKVEQLLVHFYQKLKDEYNETETVVLYEKYIDDSERRKLSEGGCHSTCSKEVYPVGWKNSIQLICYFYSDVEFYLCSLVDLNEYVESLVKDKHFKELVMVMFYIRDKHFC